MEGESESNHLNVESGGVRVEGRGGEDVVEG